MIENKLEWYKRNRDRLRREEKLPLFKLQRNLRILLRRDRANLSPLAQKVIENSILALWELHKIELNKQKEEVKTH